MNFGLNSITSGRRVQSGGFIMRKFTRVFALLLVLGALLTPVHQASADVDVQLLGAGASSSLLEGGSTSKPNGRGTGYGAMFFGRLTNSLSLRMGGISLERKTRSTSFPSRKSLLLPMIFGYRVAPGIRLELGGYYDYGLDSPAATLKRSAFGGLGGVVIDIPLISGIGLLLGGHYSMQLKTLSSTATTDVKYKDILVTAGFRLGTGR
jgi:hypothetical protein